MNRTNVAPKTGYDYRAATEKILGELKRDRDRQILARRFGFGLTKRETLEHIGNAFNITRERVRQIEKAAVTRLRQSGSEELGRANAILGETVRELGNLTLLSEVAQVLGASEQDESYIVFLTLLAPDVELIEETEELRQGAGIMPIFTAKQIQALSREAVAVIKKLGKPSTTADVLAAMPSELEDLTLEQLLYLSKNVAHFEGKWGLTSWPEVNPRSIRDKTYLVLRRHGKPLHFSDIATNIREMATPRQGKRDVTVQAVHNELIKDARFILIGRGIYALAEWGFQPGTVADIIAEVLREAGTPLHKDDIIERVLQRRHVKTTTIILNLQEKEQFVRTAKATYTLKAD